MTIRTPLSVSANVVHVEFELADPSHSFIGLSKSGDCEIELEEMLPRGSGGYTGFYAVRDGDPDQLLHRARAIEGGDARFIDQTEDGGLLQLNVSDECPGMFFAERGAFPRQVRAVDGVGYITAEILPESNEHDVIGEFRSSYPAAKLLTHRQRSYHTPMFSLREFEQAIEDRLTERQKEVLQTAYEAGYYEWPRNVTGQEVAETLGIAPATFTQHLRAAEQKLVSLLLD